MNAIKVDFGSFSENILIKSVYCVDGKTLVTLLIFEDTLLSFSIDGTNSNIVLKILFGALYGFSLHSSLHDLIKCLHDDFNVSRITIEFDYEKN